MNYIKLLFLIVSVTCVEVAHAQVTIQPGSTVTMMQGTTLTLAQDMEIQSGATLNTDGIIQLQAGSLYDSGTANFTSNSRLVFNGPATQNIYNAAPLTLATLVLNNLTGLAPQGSITIADSIVLQNGIYTATAANPLIFATTAANPAETNYSRIAGSAFMSPRAIGTAPLNFLGCGISFGADIGNVSILRNTGSSAVANVGPGYSIAANWVVHSTNDQLTPNRNLSFSWLSALDNGRDVTAMYPYASAAPFTTYTLINDTATDVSATDPRVYFRPNISQFGRMYTLSDNKPLAVSNVIAPVVKVVGFPNPFSNELNLSIAKNDNQPVQVQMIDMAGHVVLNNAYNAGSNAVITIQDIARLAAGNYLLRVYNDNFAKTLKVVKAN